MGLEALPGEQQMLPWAAASGARAAASAELLPRVQQLDSHTSTVPRLCRHDYCGVKQDLEVYWRKLKSGERLAASCSCGRVTGLRADPLSAARCP